ncbi:DHH family phosphoesterase [Halorutilales archaeon Cl-col2-1]
MDESLIEDAPIEERSLLPKPGFFVPDSVREKRKEEKIRDGLSEHSTVMIVDGDPDGLAAVAVAETVFDDLGYVYTSPNDLDETLERAVDYVEEGATVYVVDLALDSLEEVDDEYETLEVLTEVADIYWYDHHEWDDETVSALRGFGVDVVIGDSDEVCSADVVLSELENEGYVFGDWVYELVDVTRDHDLWIKEDPRSDDLADLGVYLSPDDYLEVIRDGPEIGDEEEDLLKEKREEKEKLIQLAVERAEFEDIGEVSVALTYGRCSQNEVSESLRQEGADAAAVIKPSGGVSLRGSDGFERCHEVAKLLGGGGHPRAAGCKPDIFDTMFDYLRHWTQEGDESKSEILGAFEEVVSDSVTHD